MASNRGPAITEIDSPLLPSGSRVTSSAAFPFGQEVGISWEQIWNTVETWEADWIRPAPNREASESRLNWGTIPPPASGCHRCPDPEISVPRSGGGPRAVPHRPDSGLGHPPRVDFTGRVARQRHGPAAVPLH